MVNIIPTLIGNEALKIACRIYFFPDRCDKNDPQKMTKCFYIVLFTIYLNNAL